jgi:hypothetical protein
MSLFAEVGSMLSVNGDLRCSLVVRGDAAANEPEVSLALVFEGESRERRPRMNCLTLPILPSALVRASTLLSPKWNAIVERILVRGEGKETGICDGRCNGCVVKGKLGAQ